MGQSHDHDAGTHDAQHATPGPGSNLVASLGEVLRQGMHTAYGGFMGADVCLPSLPQPSNHLHHLLQLQMIPLFRLFMVLRLCVLA